MIITEGLVSASYWSFILTHMNIPCSSKTFLAELIATLAERTTHLSSSAVWKVTFFFFFFFPFLFNSQLNLTPREKQEWAAPQQNSARSQQQGRQGSCITYEGAVPQYLNKESRAGPVTVNRVKPRVQNSRGVCSDEPGSRSSQEVKSVSQGQWGTWADTGTPVT